MTIFDRTHFLTNSRIKQLLAAAAADHELQYLYWYIEAKVPAKLTGTKAPQLQAASWPGMWIPVVAVGDDPAVSRHWAELLTECFRASNRGMEFGLGLTMDELLAEKRVYEWGEAVFDNVCVCCGGVWQASTVGLELCPPCEERALAIKVVDGEGDDGEAEQASG
jgi:hypothetical protein